MENQLIQIDGTPGTCSTAAACYFYDTQGRRVQKIIGSAETSYLFDLSGHVVAEDNGAMWVRGYVYAGGQLIAEYKNSTTYFVHDNNLGTSTILTSVAGAVVDCNALYPLGEQDNTICSPSNLTTHKFTGKERDTESNLDNFGARYYSSAQGRFLTADWSAIPAPVPNANLSDRQTLNLYAYVGNSPLGKVDPDGHEAAAATPNDEQVGNVQSANPASSVTAVNGGHDQTIVTGSGQTTLKLGNVKVAIKWQTYEDQHVDQNGQVTVQGRGVSISARPEGCDNCQWAQTVSGTGIQGTRADTQPGADPHQHPFTAGTEHPGELYDRPGRSTQPAQLKFVSTIGVSGGNNFHAIGSMTWGFTVSSHGTVAFSGARSATANEQSQSLGVWSSATGRGVGP